MASSPPSKLRKPISASQERSVIRAAFKPKSHLIPLIVLFYAILLPRELSFSIGEINMPPSRVASVLLIPQVLVLLRSNPFKLSPLDAPHSVRFMRILLERIL